MHDRRTRVQCVLVSMQLGIDGGNKSPNSSLRTLRLACLIHTLQARFLASSYSRNMDVGRGINIIVAGGGYPGASPEVMLDTRIYWIRSAITVCRISSAEA